jgi:hypothetical protein
MEHRATLKTEISASYTLEKALYQVSSYSHRKAPSACNPESEEDFVSHPPKRSGSPFLISLKYR